MFDKKIKDFVNNPIQGVVVSGVVQNFSVKHTDIVCVSPVWGQFKISLPNSCGIERGDVLKVQREVKTQSDGKQYFEYKILRNITMEAILWDKINNVILKDFNEFERQRIKILSEQQRIKE